MLIYTGSPMGVRPHLLSKGCLWRPMLMSYPEKVTTILPKRISVSLISYKRFKAAITS